MLASIAQYVPKGLSAEFLCAQWGRIQKDLDGRTEGLANTAQLVLKIIACGPMSLDSETVGTVRSSGQARLVGI